MSGIRYQEKDYFHSKWQHFPYMDIFSREGLHKAFHQLEETQEVQPAQTPPSAQFSCRNLFNDLPDFETRPLRPIEFQKFLKHFQDKIEKSSVNLFLDSPCLIVLQQRLLVLSRLSQAIVNTHSLCIMREQQQKVAQSGTCVDTALKIDTKKRSYSSTEILIETGVRTGLQLFFSLLRQQLNIQQQQQQQQQQPPTDTQLCTEVLLCLRDTFKQFPSNFLAQPNQIPPLGHKCLSDLEDFLQQIVFHPSVIDVTSRSLAAETHLTLLIEKCSLSQLLEYFSQVLQMKSCHNVAETTPFVSGEHLQHVLNEIYKSKVDRTEDSGPILVEGEQITLYRATFLIFKQILFLAEYRCSTLIVQPANQPISCEVFGFGSNNTGQFGLGEGGIDRTSFAVKLPKMSDCTYVCAGQFCTLVVHPGGYYEACGKGSFGRLGTGNSHNTTSLIKVDLKGVKNISSSHGSDGHSLAVTTEGEVFSWGEGDSGRLGHGSFTAHKSPKLIEGPFIGKVIKSVSAGWKHSAAVTVDGELYTWGDGEGGKLGHNDTEKQSRPVLVTSISGGIAQVSCGNTHTVALGQDKSVWTWGNGEGGKLGHGNLVRQLTPKEIPSLRPHISKIQAGNHVTLALSTLGKIYSWGSGPALGRAIETENVCMEPKEINDLTFEFIIDISVGDTHCLALSKEHTVYAWGNNNVGQCGIGHTNSPVYTPSRALSLEDHKIYQISAGASHSIVWTAIPSDVNELNWPFILDMSENTFKMLRGFLEKYCTGFESDCSYTPFDSIEDKIEFVVDCLNLLKIHLKCAASLTNSQDCIGKEIIPLGQLLFKLIDSSSPQPIQNAVNETLELGANLLIPPLNERLHFLWTLIPKETTQWTQLTRGQLIQVQVMLESLGNEQTVIGLLMPLIHGEVTDSDTIAQKNSILIQIVDIMMKYVLNYIDNKIDESREQQIESSTTTSHQGLSPDIIFLFKDFLILLYKHIFAHFALQTDLTEDKVILLRQHLDTIIPGCLECLNKIKLLALSNPDKLHLINDMNFPNTIIPLVTHGLLLLPLQQLGFIIDPVTELCLQLSRTVEAIPNLSHLCESQEAQWKIGELSNPLFTSSLTFPLTKELDPNWCWLVDIHRASGYLLGLILNLQLVSLPVDPVEVRVQNWTQSVLLGNGLQDNYKQGVLQWREAVSLTLTQVPFSIEQITEYFLTNEMVGSSDIPELDPVASLILDLAHARTDENTSCYEVYNQLIHYATFKEWDTNTDDDVFGLKEVSCGMLAVIAKHCRIPLTGKQGIKATQDLPEAYENIFKVRKELFSLRPLDTSPQDTSSNEDTYTQLCATLRATCLFLVHVVAPATLKEVLEDSTTPVREQSRKQQQSSQKTTQYLDTSKQQIENDKESPLDSIAVYFQPKDTFNTSKHLDTQTKTTSHASKIITTLTQFLSEPIKAYKSKHNTESQKSSLLLEPIELQSECNENLLENIAKTLALHKRRAELRYDAIKLIQTLFLSRRTKTLGQISSILPTAYRLLHISLLGNTGLYKHKQQLVVTGDVLCAPIELQLKIKSSFNKILTYVFKKIAQAAKACTKAVEKEKVPLYLDLVINMSWLQGKVNCFDVDEVCSPQILSVLAELSGIISTKLPLPFPEDNKLEKSIRDIAALLFYYISAVVGFNSTDLHNNVFEAVTGLLYGELEGQFLPHTTNIPTKPSSNYSSKKKQKDTDIDSKNELQIQTPIDFLELSLPFEFNHPVHPETLKQLVKLWSTITNDNREYSMGSYINYISRVVSTDKMKSHFATTAWVGLLLRIAGVDPENCVPRCISLRTRMSALNLLSNILMEHPIESVAEKQKIIDVIFNQMSLCQFAQPVFHISKGNTTTATQSDATSLSFQNSCNNSSCTIEGNSIAKTDVGDAFLFLNNKLESQLYSWKIKLLVSDSSINSVFIGVATMPLEDTALTSTQSCWTLDTFSGNLFNNGQLPELFTPCVTGDTIQCVFDGTNGKVSFGRNCGVLVEVFQNIKSPQLYPFLSFNKKSIATQVEFLGFESSKGTNKDTIRQVQAELAHIFTPEPLLGERACIGEGFTRLIRRLMQVESWRCSIQKSCNHRLSLMDSIVQSLVHRTITGHVEVHRLCFKVWPVLCLLANRHPVISVGCRVRQTEDDLYGTVSLSEQKQPVVFFEKGDGKIDSSVLLLPDRVVAVPLPKLNGFDWGQIGPTTLLNLAHLSGLWDDEEMNVLTAGAPFLSRGYARHLLDGQGNGDTADLIVPISVTASLEWRQFLMWQIQTMALRALQTVLTQDRFCNLLTYHPISIKEDSRTEDSGDLAHAVQQILRHIVLRGTSPSPLSPAVSLGCLELAQNILTTHGLIKLYTDCADAIIRSDKVNQTDIAIAGIPNPPPDIPLLYHPTNAPPPLPPKTKRTPNKSVPPVEPVTPVAAPAYVEQLLDMGFSKQQVDRARRKLKLNSNESIANQTSSLVTWLLEHGGEEDSGGESEAPPPLPPRDEPLLFPLTLEQTLSLEGGTYPTQTPSSPVTTPVTPADRTHKSESDMLLEGLFPDFSRTDLSSPKNVGTSSCKDLLFGPDPTAFVRDVYRNIPDISGELRENCSRLLLSKKQKNQVYSCPEDPLGANTVKCNLTTQKTENSFSNSDSKLLTQCYQLQTLDDFITAIERVTNTVKTQISRQLILHSISSLSLKQSEFMFGLANLGTQDLNLLLRLLRLSYTNRFGCHSPDTDNSVSIVSAIKQLLSQETESLARLLQICTRDIVAIAAKSTYTPDSYFLSTHSTINDCTVFSTMNFAVTKILVEIVIDVYNSTDNIVDCVYGMLNLLDALSACEFSKKLSNEDKQWSTEQLVKLLVSPRDTSRTSFEPEIVMLDAIQEFKSHNKQVMNYVWCEKTDRILSIAKDDRIKIWKCSNEAGELSVSSTLEFQSQEKEPLPSESLNVTDVPTPVPSSVLPYIAIDQSGEYIAASKEYTVNVWFIGYVNSKNNKLSCVKELGRLITYSCFQPLDASTPTNNQPTEHIPTLLFGCIDGSIYTAVIELDRKEEGSLNLEIKVSDNLKLPDNGAVVKMIFDESGHTLAVGSSRGSVSLFSQLNSDSEFELEKTLVLHENVIQNLQFNPSGTLLATLSEGEAIKISGRLNGQWDNIGIIAIPNQTCFTWLDSHMPQGKHLLACGGDKGIVYVWAMSQWPYNIQIATQSDAAGLLDKQLELSSTCGSVCEFITSVCFSTDGNFVIAGHRDGTVGVWNANSGEGLLYTQTHKQVVSVTPGGANRILTCHLNSSYLHSLSVTPSLLHTTRTIQFCNSRLSPLGVQSLDRLPFLQKFLMQLPAKLFKQHECEMEEINSQRLLNHSRIHQSLTCLALGLGLHTLWSQEYIPELFPSNQLTEEVNPKNWKWISEFKESLEAVECMARRYPLLGSLTTNLSAEEIEEQRPDNWSLDTDYQLMQWYNSHPEDWIIGGKAKVYLWGAGGSGQLANDSKSTPLPHLCEFLECSQNVIASVNCTYAIDHHGSVYSFGDGGHGKLGHNSTEAFIIPQCIETLQGYTIVQLSASKSGDCHCLALANNGEVFSWGEGEVGRLGHGDAYKQRRPKKIEALKGKNVVLVCAGDKYSAVVTKEGHLYTFGCGSEGRTGHGNTDNRRSPKQVTKFLKNGQEVSVRVGQVSCGSNHTLILSSDGMEVFSCGDGHHFKLGHGGQNSVNYPQAIPELSGVGVKKVACGKEFSIALTNNGKIYVWGQRTECCSSTDVQIPQPLSGNHALNSQFVTDIQTGPDNVVALTNSGEVWTWGSNKDGQLGVGDLDPRIQPSLVKALAGVNIRQISVGKCHTSASTAPLRSPDNSMGELGLPISIPTKYTAITNIKIESLQARLKVLSQFSSLVFSNWTNFSCNPFQYNSLDALQSYQLNKANIRPILSQNIFRSKLLHTITHTMIASKSYGPIITIRRIPSEGHNHKPLFYQISPQILAKPKELLLPQRAWKVTLIGEGADDAGGVFDETIALMCIELEDGTLPFFIPTPNARNKCGYNCDRFVLNPACCSKSDTDNYRFIGVLFGIAIRTKKPLALHLAPLVWKLIAGIEITMDDLEDVDLAFMQAMRGIRKLSDDITPATFSEMIPIASFEAYNMAGHLTPILTGGSNIPLTYSNRKEYVEKSIHFRLHELDRQAMCVREGMSLIVPVPLLSLTTGQQLETAVCGEKELDIQILKRVAKYRDCGPTDRLVKWLWDTLENFTNEEKILFLRFTSGRSRLPSRVQDVTQRLLIIKTMKNKNALPTAQTCFFHLKLPNYTSQDLLASRLRYAINNCRSIDTDGYMLPRNTEGGGISSSDDDY